VTRVVLVGPPGAGKGTQAEALSVKLGVPHISTGELFRAHMSDDTDLGRAVKRYYDAGALVPDEVTIELVRERLAEPDTEDGFMLDGFPRNVGQADLLSRILDESGTKLDAVVELAVDENVLVHRLLARGRKDDSEDVIRNRLRVYRSETAPLLDYYRDLLITVDGVGEVEEITDRVLSALRDRT
jgi:adenylate kinase